MPMADAASKVSGPPRPTIALPPRSSMMESFFTGAAAGFSPGPMTLVSNFFSDNYPDADCRSFSQLLAGAMGSPLAAVATPKEPILLADNNLSKEANGSEKEGDRDSGFRQNRPSNLVVAQSPSMFMVPTGLNSPGLLTPSFFAGLQSPFGMSHQQALAQVTAQAALSQSFNMQTQPEQHQPYTVAPPKGSLTQPQPITTQQVDTVSVISEPESSAVESSEVFQSERKVVPPSIADKPASDGYNWRKYGQKQVKASEYPRSYYRCTHPNCRVTKKVERNFEGKITEIIYKGQHNHDLPEPTKRGKSSSDIKPSLSSRASPELSLLGETSMGQSTEAPHSAPGIDQCSAQLTSVPFLDPSNYAETNGAEARVNEDVDEPNLKRRNIEVETTEKSLLHKSVSEAKIVLQTRSEVDLLDDGYKWRKYGQKVVKGNPHPRSYYKCTYTGCNVRKHVERSSTDAKAVITTYEGKHNHDVPAPRKAHNPAPELNPQKVVAKKRGHEDMEFNLDQRHLLLQLKEEQIRV